MKSRNWREWKSLNDIPDDMQWQVAFWILICCIFGAVIGYVLAPHFLNILNGFKVTIEYKGH